MFWREERTLKKFASISAVIAVILGLAIFEVYNSWQNQEVDFEEEPYYAIKHATHILHIGNFLAVTYEKDGVLVKERFKASEYLRIEEEITYGPDAYVEFFRGYRRPMLWLKDNASEPREIKVIIHRSRQNSESHREE